MDSKAVQRSHEIEGLGGKLQYLSVQRFNVDKSCYQLSVSIVPLIALPSIIFILEDGVLLL